MPEVADHIDAERAACAERIGKALNPGQEVIWSESMQTGVRRIKGAVLAELQLVAPGVKFEDTTFFNHSFIPDFRMSWVGWHGDVAERDLYLRFGCTDELFAKYDLRQELAKEAPVILSLGEGADENPEPNYPLETIQRALVLPFPAFLYLRAQPTKAGETLLCDEHGFVSVDRARALTETISPSEA